MANMPRGSTIARFPATNSKRSDRKELLSTVAVYNMSPVSHRYLKFQEIILGFPKSFIGLFGVLQCLH